MRSFTPLPKAEAKWTVGGMEWRGCKRQRETNIQILRSEFGDQSLPGVVLSLEDRPQEKTLLSLSYFSHGLVENISSD